MSEPPPYRPLFASQPFGNDQSSSINQEPTNTQGNQSLFAPSGSKLFSNPNVQNVEPAVQKPSIFGGSAFSKPLESPFAAPARQSIFGGPLQPSISQPSSIPKLEENTNVSQSGAFGKSQPIFGGGFNKSGDGLSGSNNVFGGTFTGSQMLSAKPTAFADMTSPTTEPTSTTKPNIFGGAFTRKEEPTPRSPLKVQDTGLDKPRSILSKNFSEDLSKVPIDKQSFSTNSAKFSSFSPSKSGFGRFSSSGIVTSTLSPSSHDRSESMTLSNDVDKQPINNIVDQSLDREPDNLGDENQQGSGITQSKESIKSNKTIIRKRGVYGKAIEDMAKSSHRNLTTEENRSIQCYSVKGELPEESLLKDHFAQFGRAIVTVNKDKRYVSATYKTSGDAQKAKESSKVIDGVEFKTFWRNMPKARRRSAEEVEKKSPEVKKKPLRHIEIDPSVKEELEAMSGIEYYMPKEISSKRKVAVSSEARKKSRSQVRSLISNTGAQEENQDLSQRLEVSKDIRSRSLKDVREARSEDKSSVRTRIERKSNKKPVITSDRDEVTEIKPEKGELGSSESAIIPTAAISELKEILKQQALTSDEKLKVLEARDKIMRLRQVKQYDISKAVKTVGTCPDMCPEKERILRETRRQISLYEMSSVKPNEMDPNLMVKQYSRSSADQEEPLPHELRPPAVLTMTMNYLMHSIMSLGDQPGENLGEWYHFLWDRLRGIRKEITQQELCDRDAVHLVEQCARFHIHCGGRLVAEDMSVFDDRINTENLTKCLQTLKHMYHDLWTNNSTTCHSEPEFISYFLLLNLNTGIIMWEMEQLREEVLRSPEISFVAAMYNSLSSNNFVRFFRLVRKASYLNSCLCIRYFVQVREKALSTYVKALAKIRPVQYPLSALVEELGFENIERAAAFCTHYGLMVDNESTFVTLSPDTFENPTYRFPSERALRLAESKKMGSVGEVVYGGPLPSRSFEGHGVHESFDENGYLRKDAFYAKDQSLSDFGLKEGDDGELVRQAGKRETLASFKDTVVASSSVAHRTDSLKKNLLQIPTVTFGGSGYQNMFPSTFSNLQPGTSTSINTASSQLFKTALTRPTQSASEKQDTSKLNLTQSSSVFEPIKRLIPVNPFNDQSQADAQAKAQAAAKQLAEMKAHAELEDAMNKAAELEVQELVELCVQDLTAEIALLEWNNAEEEDRALEQRRVEEQIRAQEELRQRLLDAHIERISSDSLTDLLQEVVSELVSRIAQEAHSAEEKLIEHVKLSSEESLAQLLNCVISELSYNMALEELKQAQALARQEAVQIRVKQLFYFWLERARRSLHRRHVMEDFPASVIPLSVKEHAERWGFAGDVQANALEACSKGTEKSLDFLELKAIRAYPQIAFAELIGVQVVHRYDAVRSKLDLRPTDKLLYKTYVSVPEDFKDSATELIDWWIRRTFKQNCTMLCDDQKKGVFRLVSGVKVTSEVAVYASLQMVRGQNPLKKQPGLVSGSSAVLFTVSPSSNLLEGKARLSALLKSMRKLPSLPLVVAVISPTEPPIAGLKQLAQELDLDQWLSLGVICDYQILHVRDLFDIKYLSERFNMAFNYMVMTWTPSPEFSLVCFKNVLKSTFQMFYISVQFNHNSSEVYPQDIDDPRVIVGLCNEWLDHMCCEFVESYYEARLLCGDEFWPLIYKGAYLPFLNNPSYVQILRKVILAVHLPTIEWPPSSEADFESLIAHYCSWLGPDEKKQTIRRLSCLNGLAWPDKLKSIPWVNLIEDWMEARINYLETCALFGTELLCLMRTPNVEHLYTYPWWAQSRYILSYLETHGFGGDCAMDVDQTIPNESLSNGDLDKSSSEDQTMVEPISAGLPQLQEVTNSVNEFKTASESLLRRSQTALADGSEDFIQPVNHSHIITNAPDLKTDAKAANSTNLQNLKSIVETVTSQDKAEQDFRSNSNLPSSQALDEAGRSGVDKKSEKPITNLKKPQREPSSIASTVSQPMNEEDIQGKNTTSTKIMDEIMASMNSIVSSLDQKYKILDSSSCFERISDLKMGVGKVDNVAALLTSEDLHSSLFVEQSQRRMQEKLQRSAIQDSEATCEKPLPHNTDSDLEMLSDERSTSTVLRTESSASSSIASEYNKSESETDVEFDETTDPRRNTQSENSRLRDHSDRQDGNRSRKRPQRHRSDSESDSDIQSGKRIQWCNSDSEQDGESGERIRQYYSSSEDDRHGGKMSQQYHSGSEDENESGILHEKANRGSEDNVRSARRRQHHHSDCEDPEDSNSSTYDHHYDSADDESKEKTEHHSSDSESVQKAQHKQKNIKGQGLPKNKVQESKSEDVESDGSSSEDAGNSDCDDDVEEVHTISSEESQGSTANHVDHSSVSESASHHNDNYFLTDNNPSSVNYVVCENELPSENGLLSNVGNEEGNLLNLDNVQNHFQYYEGNLEMCEGNTYYTISSDVGVLHSGDVPNEAVLSNSDPTNEGNHVLVSQFEPNGENAVQNVYEVELDEDENEVCDESVVDCIGETFNSNPNEDGGQFSEDKATPSKENYQNSQFEESDSAEEESEEEDDYVGEENVEEEEFEELEEEGEEDEELEEAMEEEREEDAESEVASEADEDSDICEVIDD